MFQAEPTRPEALRVIVLEIEDDEREVALSRRFNEVDWVWVVDWV